MISKKFIAGQTLQISRVFQAGSTIKTTTFPTIVPMANYYHSLASRSSKPMTREKPTIVISSDNEEVESVAGHVRV